jgi:hypothetical protein
MSVFWNTGLHARSHYASETDCDRPKLYRSSVIFLSFRQIAELLSKFHFVFYIYNVALPKLLLSSAAPSHNVVKISSHCTVPNKITCIKFGLTAHILSPAVNSDSPLPVTQPTQRVHFVTIPTQRVHFPSPYLLRRSTSRHLIYSDIALLVTLPTQTSHFLSPYLLG